MSSFFLLSTLCSSACAYSVFNTNCTIAPHVFNYVSSPNTRGTIDIAWSCIATIVACVYTVLHLNLPRRPEHVSPTRARVLRWENDIVTPGLMITIGTFCPEWIFAVALMEYWDASHQLKLLRESSRLQEEDPIVRESWSLQHMFFANMGGFVLMYKRDSADINGEPLLNSVPRYDLGNDGEKPNSTDLDQVPSIPESVIDFAHLNINHGQIGRLERRGSTNARLEQTSISVDAQADIEAGLTKERSLSAPAIISPPKERDYTYYQKRRLFSHAPVDPISIQTEPQKLDVSKLAWGGYRRYHLTAPVLRRAIEMGLLPAKAVPEEDIGDRAKSDWFTKLLISLQLISFFSTVLARVAEHLPVCPLEVATSAFAVCSLITFVLLFEKPQAAYAPIVLGIYDTVPEEIQELKMRYIQLKLEGEAAKEPIDLSGTSGRHGRPPYFLDPPTGGDRKRDTFGYPTSGMLSGLVFGGLHVAGWFLEFPTVIDLWLWRGAAVATAVIPILALPITLRLGVKYEKERTGRFWDLYVSKEGFILVCVVVPAYILARLILLVETIRTLFYLAPAIYETPSWSIGIPHIS